MKDNSTASGGSGRRLGDLLAGMTGAAAPLDRSLTELRIRAIAHHSAKVSAGSLFVAVPGAHSDGRRNARDAVERGAVAVVAEKPLDTPETVPIVRVADARRALAELAAAWHGRPADDLALVGITGTVGKTSVLSMLDAILSSADVPLGTIGSLGIRVGGHLLDETGFTAPDALTLQRALAHIVDAGIGCAAMEVTSHALVQRRVETLRFDLGVFTNLLPFEHVDYHRTFRGYVQAKTLFFGHLKPGSPLIYNAEDRVVRGVVRGRDVLPFGCGASRVACVRVESRTQQGARTNVVLNVRRALPRLDGDPLQPVRVPLELQLLGRTNVLNAVLASATAFCLGAEPAAAVEALRDLPPPRRRMQLEQYGGVLVLDDTVGHPDSVSAAFEVASQLAADRLLIVFGVRGSRGRRINRRLGEALAIWAARVRPHRLVITACEDVADERNRVQEAERAAFVDALLRHGIAFEEQSTCRAAVELAAGSARPGDLLLLLGAQAMDASADFARAVLEPEPAPARR